MMEYPNPTLPIIFFFNLSYLPQGDLEKIRPKRPTKFGRNDPGPKQPGPKRPRAETTQGQNDPGPFASYGIWQVEIAYPISLHSIPIEQYLHLQRWVSIFYT